MTTRTPVGVESGSDLRPPVLLPLTARTVEEFASASGDRNPIHLDASAARAAGLPGVIVHGMFSMACLGRLLTAWAPQESLRSFRANFVAPVAIGDRLICEGTVTSVIDRDGERQAHVRLTARRSDGTTVVRGQALIAWAQGLEPSRPTSEA